MLIKFGLECKFELNTSDIEFTVNKNKGQGVFNKCSINGK
jgi:hypothetical protein